MSADRAASRITSILGDLVYVAVFAELLRLIAMYFGSLSSREFVGAFIDLTSRITIPVGANAIKTPNGGVFDIDTVVTIVVLLGVEWLLGRLGGRD